MRDSEYAFFVIVLNTSGHYSQPIEKLGIPIHYLTIQKTNVIKTGYHLLSLIRQIKPDIVHTWLYHSDLIGGVAAKLCGVKKIIWSIRCEGVHLKRSTQWIKKTCALLSWIIPTSIITNSKIAAKNHIQAGYNSKKITVIYNGFDANQFSTQQQNNPLSPMEKRARVKGAVEETNSAQTPPPLFIGTLARFHPDKGYANLIQAIQTVCSQHDHVYFVFCGQGCHTDNPDLKELLITLTDQDRVILINGIEDTAGYLNALDLFVLPSKTEGFPNSLAEAMLCERPCIATDVGEVRNILGDTGLIVPNDDPNCLAAACLSMILKSQHERQQLGTLARKRIEQHYSITKNTKQMNAIYQGSTHPCVD